MRKLLPYKGTAYTLQNMYGQILDSLPYCRRNFSGLDTPGKIWDHIKPRLTYVPDPQGLELLQSVQTLMDPAKNWHRIAGAGDCDCFTLLTLAVLTVNPVYKSVDKFAVLVGNNPDEPSHIYSALKWRGRLIAIDFTNPALNWERPYKFRQYIPFNL